MPLLFNEKLKAKIENTAFQKLNADVSMLMYVKISSECGVFVEKSHSGNTLLTLVFIEKM